MKIGIIGTACSGKTTLANQIAKYFSFELIDELARYYPRECLKSEEVQYQMLLHQIQYEMFAGRFAGSNVITDRTIIDNYIHLERLFKPKRYTLNLVRTWAETYDIIFLCKKLPFVEDGFRENCDMEHDFIKFMKCNHIRYEVLEGNEFERFDMARKVIERKYGK